MQSKRRTGESGIPVWLAALVLAASVSCVTASPNDVVAACLAKGGHWIQGNGCTDGFCSFEADVVPPRSDEVPPEDEP